MSWKKCGRKVCDDGYRGCSRETARMMAVSEDLLWSFDSYCPEDGCKRYWAVVAW